MKPRSNPFGFIALALVSATSLHASTLYWDGAATTPDADGGAGTWDSTSTNWNDAATAGNALAWPSSGTDNDAVFGTPAGLVTIDAGGVSANDLTFGLTGYTVEGGTLTLNGTTNILTSTAAAAGSPVTNLTISAPLAGTNGFTKAGIGNVILSGDNTGLSGIVTINNATGTNNSGLSLSGANAPGGITRFDVNGSAAVADGSFLSLSNTTLSAGTTVNLSGQGGNSAPIGTLRGSGGNTTVEGPVNILTPTVRISNNGGTSLTLNGAVTATPAANGCYIRFGLSQGVIFSNTSNTWSGVTNLGEGSVYFYPGTLPATTALTIGSSNPGDFGTNGSFTRPLGTAAGQISFGRAADGQRAMGFTARGGDLTVNLGGAAADFTFAPMTTAATTTGTWTNNSAAVTVASTAGITVGMYVTGTGIPTDTRVSAIAGSVLTLNRAGSPAGSGTALSFLTLAPLDNSKFNSYTFVLNGANSDSALTFQNPVDLNGFNRFLQVSANTTTLTGGLKNSAATVASARKTGAGTLIHDPGNTHTLTLAGLNTNAGTLELKSGTITVSGSAGTSAPDSSAGFIVSRGATFRLNGGNVTATGGTYIFPAGNTAGGNSKFILDSGTFNADGREVLNAYGADGSTTINGGLFVCQGFKVSQSTTGILNLNGGTLRAVYLYNAGSTVNFNGGTLQAKVARTDFVATSVTTAQIQSGGAVIDSNNFAITIPKILTEDSGSPGGGLTKKGAGILDLTADNTYTGTNLIQSGVLRVSASSKLGAVGAPVTVNGGEFGVSGTTIPSISSLGRPFTYTTGGFHVGDVSHTLDVDIALTGSAALSKSGPGTIKLTGANDFTGGISMGGGDSGWIEVDSAADLGTGAKLANLSSSTGSAIGGIRLLGNVTVSDVALNLGGRNINAATQHALLNVSGNNVWTGNINITNAGGTYYLRSDSGQLELSGILSNAQIANLTPDTRAFNLEGAGDYLISGTIADGAETNRFTALVIDGSGTTTLTGTNTYTGSTSVNAGKLLINGDNTAAVGNVLVNGTANLGGSGTIGGSITVGETATLAPGSSVGTLTVLGGVAGSGTLAIEGNDTSADKLVIGGSLDISALQLNLALTSLTQPVYVIVDASSSITGASFAAVTGTIPAGYTLTYNYNDGIDSNNIALVNGAASPFITWATTTNGLVGTAAAAGADPDNDGLQNAVEFVLGGQPNPANPNASSNTLAPTSVIDPANLVFTYRSTELSQTQPGIQATVQYGSDLGGWTTAVNAVNGVSITVTDAGFGAGVDKVEVSIPRSLAVDSKLFARLHVVIP